MSEPSQQGGGAIGLHGRQVLGLAGVRFEIEQTVRDTVGGVGRREGLATAQLTHGLGRRAGLCLAVFWRNVPARIFVAAHDQFPVAHPQRSG